MSKISLRRKKNSCKKNTEITIDAIQSADNEKKSGCRRYETLCKQPETLSSVGLYFWGGFRHKSCF